MTFTQPPFWASRASRLSDSHRTLTLVTAPVAEPLTAAEARAHLLLPASGIVEDTYLDMLIQAARMDCEAYTDLAFMPQTWRQTMAADPPLPLVLRKAPLVTSTAPVITYIDSAGDSQTWATTQYFVEAPAGPYPEPGRILPAYGQTVWPTTSPLVRNGFSVQFVAGWTNAAAVPAYLKAAMLLLIGHWFVNREAVTMDSPGELPFGVRSLLDKASPVVLA